MRPPSGGAAGFGGWRYAQATLCNFLVVMATALAASVAAAQDALPGISGIVEGLDDAALTRHSGIVTVPSWVGLVGGADYARRGAMVESSAGDGQIAIASGSTAGLEAPAAGNLVPSITPEARRTANLSSAAQLSGAADLRFTAGLTDTREMLPVTPDSPGLGERQRTAAGFGSALALFDDRLRLGGEFAGARLRDGFGTTGEDDITGIAQRLNGQATLLESGSTRFGVSGFHQSARAGYLVPSGVIPDWEQDGVGARLALGPVQFGFQADRSHNNLDADPDVLTQEQFALRPSFALSLERLRPPHGSADPEAFTFGRLIPSTVRLDLGAVDAIGLAEPGGNLTVADETRQRIRTGSIAFDWNWDRATTTLALAGDSTDSIQPGKEALDSAGHGLWISHAIRGKDLAATLAVGLRRAESFEPGNRSETDSVDLFAAFARRNFFLGDMVTSFAVHQGRRDALDALYTEIDTTWQARAAFDIAELPSATEDGRLTMAVSFNGNDPDVGDDMRWLDVVFGLAAQMRF